MSNLTKDYAVFLLKSYNGLTHVTFANQRNASHMSLLKDLRHVEEVILELPENERAVVVDLYLNGLKWEDVMEKHYVSHTTIARYRKKVLSRIEKKLKEQG